MVESKIQNYFNSIDTYVENIYSISKLCKKQGFDPKLDVEMPIAKDVAERVEGLISVEIPEILGCGVAKEISELEKKYNKQDWRVAFEIAYQIACNKFINFSDKKLAIECGVRVGFAYITMGVISAPLEGFIGIDIKKTNTGEDYICMNFAGPIRAAGGTAGAVSVLICDYVSSQMGYKKYDPTQIELKRFYTELMDYNDRCVRLQYVPSKHEVEFLIENINIEISGSPTEKIEVSNYKDLPRMKTNKIRGGMCLVVGECLIQKAAKIYKNIEKWGESMGMGNWLFLKEFLEIQKKEKAHQNSSSTKISEDKILPNYKFMEDMVAGRPVFGFPMRKGGFRLRYGRCRTSGFASTSIGVETLAILDDFLAVGTQLRLERPGKATVITACDDLQKPIVKLKNEEVIKLENVEMCEKYKNEIKEIIHLGDILISFGEFSENNHKLIPNGYCEEEWCLELIEKLNKK
jgi:DNA polymerase II large subunit